jgi:PAS domain S-box-containing protein
METETGTKTPALKMQERYSLAVFLLVFVVMTVGIAAVGYLSYCNYERQFRAQVESQLASIAELKVDELRDWRHERMADAGLFYQDPAFSEQVQRYLENPADVQAQAALQSWLDKYQAYDQYGRVFLLDVDGVERISSPAAPEPVAVHVTGEIAAILSAGQVTFLDFHRDTADDPIYLALLVPIYAAQDKHPLGLVVLRIDPNAYLYPYLQEWPVPSASAEIALVRRDGDYAVHLSELRFQENAALNLRVPLEDTQRVAVKAVLGQEGIVEGVNYRGVPVIAYMRAVPDSPWFLAPRVDVAEVYAPLRARVWQTVVFFSALVATAGAALGLIWWQQRARYYRGQAQAAEALRQSESKFKAVFENAPIGISLLDTERKLFETNLALERITHITKDGLLAGAYRGRKYLRPDGTEMPPGEFASTRALNEKQPVHDVETGIVTEDGHVIWTQVSAAPLGLPTGRIVVITQDITERKLAEDALRSLSARQQALLSAIPDIIMEVDEDKVYTWANRAGVEFFGEDVLGKEAAFYFEGEQDTYDTVQPLFDGDENVIYVESWQRRKDGEKRLLAWWCRVLKNDSGNVAGALSSARDITERKRQEAEILAAQTELQRLLAEADQSRRALLSVVEGQKRAEEEIRRLNAGLEERVRDRTAQLEAANKELEAFAYSVSHDLRAPLRAMDGFSAALLSQYPEQLDGQGRHYLERIQEASRRMGQLIDDMLTLSRVTRRELSRQQVDLSTLAREIAADLQAQDPQRQVEFVIAEGLAAEADLHLLRIALQNLLGNAWKFTGRREQARIEIGCLSHPVPPPQAGKGREGAAYFIRDNGVGFDMAYAGKLFAPFQRLHRMHEFPGTGIGLATVQRIVARHGGRVWTEAAVDQGATFYFTLGGL